jgi:hypothetical protein
MNRIRLANFTTIKNRYELSSPASVTVDANTSLTTLAIDPEAAEFVMFVALSGTQMVSLFVMEIL